MKNRSWTILAFFLLVGCAQGAVDSTLAEANSDSSPEESEDSGLILESGKSIDAIRGPASEEGDLGALEANSDKDGSSDTAVMREEVDGDRSLTATRDWRAPNYSMQESALGWTDSSFKIPAGLETNVAFWIDIYGKYTTDQGVLHDTEYIDLVYEVLDFTSISAQGNINNFKKERLRTQMVKSAKERILTMLSKFEKLKNPGSLSTEERRIWDYFQKIDGKKKFREAASKSRLRFQLGQKDRIQQGIFFSGRYLEDFERIFREAGLPIELTRLPFVESSFNVLARSKVGASGLWQIMPYTGRPYLMMNDAIDKRNHPTEATKLAAKLLRNNYRMLNSWPLALTGYNHGPSGVLRLTKSYNSRELGDLLRKNGSRRRLGFASRNFYSCFMAVLEIEKNAPKYFGSVQWSRPLEQKDIILSRPIEYGEMMKWFERDDHRAQIFNPHITTQARKGKLPLPKNAVISVPGVLENQVLADLAMVPESPVKKSRKSSKRSAFGGP